MKLEIKAGTTGFRLGVFIADTSSDDGAGLAGLLFNSAGLKLYYWRSSDLNVAATAVTLVTATRGTWASGGFIAKDGTNMPGYYEIGLPNAMIAPGAAWVHGLLRGANNMAPLPFELVLTSHTPNDYTESANVLLDLANAIEAGVTLRQSQRAGLAWACGKASGADTANLILRAGVTDHKPRITMLVDQFGNRTSVITDLT